MKVSNYGKMWTGQELEEILKLARSGEKTLKESANKFGRTLAAVKLRMHRVGISLNTLNPTISKRELKARQGFEYKDIQNYSLKIGGRYKVDLKIMGRNDPVEYLTCLENYEDFIRFKTDAGVNVCHLKVDLISNPGKIKEIK